MIIGVDLRCLPADGSPGAGVAHAARALSHALLSISGPEVTWKWYVPRGASVSEGNFSMKEKRPQIIRLASADGGGLRRALSQDSCDVLFVPSGAVAPGIRIPTVPWVHDLAIFDHPEWFPQSFFRRLISTRLFRRGLQRANHVLAVSHSTAQEIASRFLIDRERITVTGEGGDEMLSGLNGEDLQRAKVRAKRLFEDRGIVCPFLLCLGTLEPRKNIPFILSVWKTVATIIERPIDVVIAGRIGWKAEPILQAIQECQSFLRVESRVHRLDRLTDQERREALLAAELVVVPSLHEGFGLVALEAMQAGTAVVVSDVGGLCEIVGTSGIRLPSKDRHAWVQMLVRLLNNDVERETLAGSGKLHSQNMTWEFSARIAFDVLTQVLA